jgi:hypothetical protein
MLVPLSFLPVRSVTEALILMKKSPLMILNPQTARFTPDQVALLAAAAQQMKCSRSDLLRKGALALAEQALNATGVAV